MDVIRAATDAQRAADFLTGGGEEASPSSGGRSRASNLARCTRFDASPSSLPVSGTSDALTRSLHSLRGGSFPPAARITGCAGHARGWQLCWFHLIKLNASTVSSFRLTDNNYNHFPVPASRQIKYHVSEFTTVSPLDLSIRLCIVLIDWSRPTFIGEGSGTLQTRLLNISCSGYEFYCTSQQQCFKSEYLDLDKSLTFQYNCMRSIETLEREVNLGETQSASSYNVIR